MASICVVMQLCGQLLKQVCLEGNIGSGKSTSLTYLANKYDQVTALSEPVDKWQDLNGHNLIELMYKDLNRNAFGFETYAQLTRLQMYADSYKFRPNKPIRLMERSIYSQRYCFTENLIQRFVSVCLIQC